MGDKTTERLDYYFYTWEVVDKSIVPFNFIYVGSTAHMKSRTHQHKHKALISKSTEPLYLCMRKYGYDKFKMNVIGTEKQLTKTEARLKEQEYIDKLRTSSEVCLYCNFNEEEYKNKPNTLVILNAISAYSMFIYKKIDSCIAREQYIQQKDYKITKEGTDYNNIMNVINNSKIHEIEYEQINTGELHKIKFYGLLSSNSKAIKLYFIKRNYERTYMNDDGCELEPPKETTELYEYNCPMIRTELFDNRDKKMVIKYLKELVNDMETE